jgi:hypothetical protein
MVIQSDSPFVPVIRDAFVKIVDAEDLNIPVRISFGKSSRESRGNGSASLCTRAIELSPSTTGANKLPSQSNKRYLSNVELDRPGSD